MDVKLVDDDYSFEELITRMNACLPRGIQLFDVTEPIMKAGKIAYADFTALISGEKVRREKSAGSLRSCSRAKKSSLKKVEKGHENR